MTNSTPRSKKRVVIYLGVILTVAALLAFHESGNEKQDVGQVLSDQVQSKQKTSESGESVSTELAEKSAKKQDEAANDDALVQKEKVMELHQKLLGKDVPVDYQPFKNWLEAEGIKYSETVAGSAMSGQRVELKFQYPVGISNWTGIFDIYAGEEKRFRSMISRSKGSKNETMLLFQSHMNSSNTASHDDSSFKTSEENGYITWGQIKERDGEAELVLGTEVFQHHEH